MTDRKSYTPYRPIAPLPATSLDKLGTGSAVSTAVKL
jgi:hypothetical protein